MDFSINNSEIEKSFDRIATDLFTKNTLFINNKEFQITEIEFYYYYYHIHEDNYRHDHKRDEGEWRFHNQGIDITFQANENQVGGLLILGLKVAGEHINSLQ